MFVVFVCVKKKAKHFMCANTDEVSFIFYSKICFCREGVFIDRDVCVRACVCARTSAHETEQSRLALGEMRIPISPGYSPRPTRITIYALNEPGP